MKQSFSIMLFLLIGILFNEKASSQASVASDDIEDVSVTLPGNIKQSYTVIRDARNRKQFYYIPDRPRLFEKPEKNTTVPEFTLLRYQYKATNDPNKLLEGGFLQFGVTMQLPSDVIDQIKTYLQTRYGQGINLGPITLKSATVSAYSPVPTSVGDSCPVIGSVTAGNGLAPLFSSQKMAFSFPYNKLGTNIIDPIVNSETGIPVFITLTYLGLTPKAGFTVHIDWLKTYHHYSEDKKFKAEASYFGLFGASYEYSAQKLFNELTNSKCITVEGVTGEGFSATDLQTYLQPVLARINSEILSNAQPPNNISPATATSPSANGKFFSAGYSFAMKKETEISHTVEDYSFSIQTTVERTTVVSGFIGIGQYSKEIKDRLVINATKDLFKSSRMLLPITTSTEDANDLRISRVEISLRTKKNQSESDAQLVYWQPSVSNNDWQDLNGTNRKSLLMPLMDEWMNSNQSFKDVLFKEKLKISFSSFYSLEFEKEYPAYSGDGSMSGFEGNRFDILEINPVGLGFNQIDSHDSLTEVKVKLYFDNTTPALRSIKPISTNGVISSAQSLKYIIPKLRDINSITCNITFIFKNGMVRSWKYNNNNVKYLDNFKDGLIMLTNDQIIN